MLRLAAVTGAAAIGSTAFMSRSSESVAAASGGGPFYDVRLDFGAKGDGKTDDVAAIQDALDVARAAGGGVVYFPPGTYMVSVASRIGGPGPAWPFGGIGQEGFHIDDPTCTNIVYTGCIAGGVTSVQSPQYPFTSGQSLGCKYGFVCTVAAKGIQYVGCTAESNAAAGFELRQGTFLLSACSSRNNGAHGFSFSQAPIVSMQGGNAEGNNIGVWMGTAADAAGVRITGAPQLTGNVKAAVHSGTSFPPPPTNVAAPTMPSSGAALTNLFGFDATVYVSGGNVMSVAVANVTTGLTSGSFRVPAGQSIKLTYSAPPTWMWFLD